MRILCIDDEGASCRIIAKCLEADGHDVECSEDGLEGLEKFRKGAFDLVITDEAMPQLRGSELAQTVKKLKPETLVILLTGYGVTVSQAEDPPEGVDQVISKPVSMAQLQEAVKTVADDKS